MSVVVVVVVVVVVGEVVVEPITVEAGVEVVGTGVVVIEVVGEVCRRGCFWSSWFCCRAIHFLYSTPPLSHSHNIWGGFDLCFHILIQLVCYTLPFVPKQTEPHLENVPLDT